MGTNWDIYILVSRFPEMGTLQIFNSLRSECSTSVDGWSQTYETATGGTSYDDSL